MSGYRSVALPRSVSAPSPGAACPASVSAALAAPPFKASTTRRDLSTTFRAFSTAWASLEQVQVLGASCKRLGERAAEVLQGVRAVLEQVERDEMSKSQGKVVIERSYEFQGGSGGAGETGSKTVFKVQSVMLDIQMFATDHLATSNHSRLALLVDSLPASTKILRKLTAALSSCLSVYSLSSVSTTSWADEDDADLAEDRVALPRLFQLSIALRGPVYDRFVQERAAWQSPSTALTLETPGQRRAAFIEWCLGQNPLLRAKEGSSPSSTIRRSTTKISWPPAETIGLGLPQELQLPSATTPMRRALSQPAPSPTSSMPPLHVSVSAASTELTDASESVAPVPTFQVYSTAATSLVEIKPKEGRFATPIAPSAPFEVKAALATSTNSLALNDYPTSLPFTNSLADEPLAVFSPDPSLPEAPILSALEPTPARSTPSTLASDVVEKADSLVLERSDSTASSAAMTVTGSTGSVLFEPVLPPLGDAVVTEEPAEVQAQPERKDKTEEELEMAQPAGQDLVASDEKVEPTEEAQVRVTDDECTQAPAAGLPVFAVTDEQTSLDEQAAAVPSIAVPLVEPAPPALNELSLPPDSQTPAYPSLDIDIAPPFPPAQPSPTLIVTPSPDTVDPQTQSPSPGPEEPSSPLVDSAAPAPSIVNLTPASPPAPPSPTFIVTPSPETAAPALAPPPKPSHFFRILALDGGGLVGPIPQLLALKQHLSSISGPSLPSAHFDLVVGTSSSALPALLLGQLGLSIDETLEVCRKIARAALGLEGPATTGAGRRVKPKPRGRWSKIFGLGGRAGADDEPQTVRREDVLEAAIRRFFPGATAPLSGARSGCTTVILAFERALSSGGRAQERWLSADSGSTLLEIVKASMAASSTFSGGSTWTTSPTSLNPSASALSFAHEHSLVPSGQHVELVSLGIGYSMLALDSALSPKKLPRSRIEALRLVKQLSAGNAATAEALAKKLDRHDGVRLIRIDGGCDGAKLGIAVEASHPTHLRPAPYASLLPFRQVRSLSPEASLSLFVPLTSHDRRAILTVLVVPCDARSALLGAAAEDFDLDG
ncbi:hypothetical protein JCM1841_005246 [Sporobolomyces salmonicolor]